MKSDGIIQRLTGVALRAGLILIFFFPTYNFLWAQDEPDSYLSRFTEVSRAYARNPQSVEALYNLTHFYFDNSHPLRNLPLAMQYARLTEDRQIYLLRNDKVNELVRLQRKNITIATIRDLKNAIVTAAFTAVRLRDDMPIIEIDQYLVAFGDNSDLVKMLRERRFQMVYRETMDHGSADECYAFFTTYPGIAESEQVEERLTRLAIERMETMGTIAAVDSLAACYEKSNTVRRAAERRKGQLAYVEALRGGAIADYSDYLSRYPASDESQLARDRIDHLLEIDLARRTTAMELAHFADSNSDLAIADQALARLRRIIYSTRDVEAAQYYVDHFKLDPYWSEVYSRYYLWHAVEGNGAPLDRFARLHDDFPFPHALEDDLERAYDIDALPLMDDYTEKAYDRYAEYIRNLIGKAIAVVPMQRMLQPLLRECRYSDALFRLEQFEICFDNQYRYQYDELQRLLSTSMPGRTLRAEKVDSCGVVLHPAVNAADKRLYFSDGRRICSARRNGSRWVVADTVSVAGAFGANLEFFGFSADGMQMVLGSGGDIWIADRDGDGWRVSDIPPYPVNTDYIETDAYLLPDGSGMLLASDRPGGQNLQPSGTNFHGDTALATDLWFIPYSQQHWGTPVNLGIKVNSIYSERSPILSRNLKTLYFVSDGNVGLGYGDVYVTERTDLEDWTSWSAPENMGREVNSAFRETSLSFSPDESRIYLSSNCTGTSFAAYSFPTNHSTQSTAGSYVLNVGDLGRTLVRVQVADVARQTIEQVVDYGGKTETVDLNLYSDRRYALLADAGTQFVSATVVKPADLGRYRLPAYTYEELVAMDRPLPLPVVQFSSGGDVLLPVAQMQLEQLARFLKQHPQAVVEFVVDVAGSDARQCFDLALGRGAVLRDFLSARGIAARRMMVSPYGNVRAGMSGADAVGVRFRE